MRARPCVTFCLKDPSWGLCLLRCPADWSGIMSSFRGCCQGKTQQLLKWIHQRLSIEAPDQVRSKPNSLLPPWIFPYHLQVLTRVLGHYPDRRQLLIDAGFTSLTKQGRGAQVHFANMEAPPAKTLFKTPGCSSQDDCSSG